MSEKLLTRKEVTQRLCLSVRTFYRHKARLTALGLQQVKLGYTIKFRESSLDRVIKYLAENGL